MKTASKKGIEFDPGFAPHILAFQGTVQYLYTDINRFKNLSQKQMRFRQFYKKILDVFYNNIGFYTGCLLWAAYIKAQPKQKILNNNCLGAKYDEAAEKADTQYMLNFMQLFPKDMKYFLNQEFIFEEQSKKLLETYEEFIILNKGFTESEYNTDILLPESVKTDKVEEFKDIIDKAIQSKDLGLLKESISIIM